MKGPLKLGLIGCGRAAERLYLPALAGLPQARLVGVADPRPERRELAATARPNCRTFSSAEALLDQGDLDAVIITTPPETHLAIATLALQANLPTLVEKPLALSPDGLDSLAALEAASAGWVMVGFNRRYWQPVRQLRQVMHQRHPAGSVTPHLVLTSDIGGWSPINGAGDPLADLGTHQLDLLRFIFADDILAISARWIARQTITMQVRLSRGIALCSAGYSPVTQEAIRVSCAGRSYWVQLGSERIEPVVGPIRTGFDILDGLNRRLLGRRSSLRRSYEQQLSEFFACVSAGTRPPAGLEDGVAVVRAVQVARQSAALDGKEVPITS